jgi:hypothetical protein
MMHSCVSVLVISSDASPPNGPHSLCTYDPFQAVMGVKVPHMNVYLYRWGAGRDGKKVYMELDHDTRRKVTAFYDVDPAKLANSYFDHQYVTSSYTHLTYPC